MECYNYYSNGNKSRKYLSHLYGKVYTEYTYYPNGLRMTAGEMRHIWDGNNIIAERIGTYGLNKYIRGIQLIASEYAGINTRKYYLYNDNGDVVQLKDNDGYIYSRYNYDAFGNPKPIQGYTPAYDSNPFRYRGEYLDTQTGNYYLRARYYDPSIGRFTQEDTHWNVGNMVYTKNGSVSIEAIFQSGNLYGYCMGNPVRYIDPSGESWQDICNFLKGLFGAEASVVNEMKRENAVSPIFNSPSPITIKTGAKTSTTISKNGDASKFISVYAKGRSDNWILSSAGIKINISGFTLNISLGLDDIGISVNLRNGETTNSLSLKANISELKIGFEGANTIQGNNNTNFTSYTNGSVDGWLIAALYIFANSGVWQSSPQGAY